MPSGSVNFMLDSVSVGNIGDYFCSESSCECSTPARHILEFLRLHSTLRLHLQQMSCYSITHWRERESSSCSVPRCKHCWNCSGGFVLDCHFFYWANWQWLLVLRKLEVPVRVKATLPGPGQCNVHWHCTALYSDTVLYCTFSGTVLNPY